MRLRRSPSAQVDVQIVVLSNVWLDEPVTMKRLQRLFSKWVTPTHPARTHASDVVGRRVLACNGPLRHCGSRVTAERTPCARNVRACLCPPCAT